MGIPHELHEKIFRPFEQAAGAEQKGGTGLGLAIAKHIMLAHGGSIRAESELNHGATFVFTLPTAA